MNSLIYQLLAIIFGCVLIIGLVFYLIQSSRSGQAPLSKGEPVQESTEEPALLPVDRDLRGNVDADAPSLSAILDQVHLAYGGRDRIRSFISSRQQIGMESIRDGRSFDVTVIYRMPNRIRYTFLLEGYSLRRAFDGERAWEARLMKQRVLNSEDLSGVEQIRFIRDTWMSRPAFINLIQPESLRLLSSTKLNERDVYVLELMREGYAERYFIDQQNFLCLRIERDDSDLDEPPHLVQLDMSDFREVDGLVFPHKHQVRADHTLITQSNVREIEINPGVLSPVFHPPSGHPVKSGVIQKDSTHSAPVSIEPIQ